MPGDLLTQDDVDAVVNAVNCVGIMGKGIALRFKSRWPANFTQYVAACKAGQVRPGKMLVHDTGGRVKPHYIINFPTKEHWREASKLEFIRHGLVDLVGQVRRLQIRSIAIPALGCGNGGLAWSDVRPLVDDAFRSLSDVDVRLFEPRQALDPKIVDVQTERRRG
jgi:O-acetyl-ADP-ribose deacetylase (regulator of RNase III)